MSAGNPPRGNRTNREMDGDSDDGLVDADIVAEEIEAGFDMQADAAVRSMARDHASSSDNDILPDA